MKGILADTSVWIDLIKRKSNDCLIAYHTIFYNIPVLHRDRDFNIMSQHSSLKVVSVD